MIRPAHEMDLLTTPYAFNPDEATAMAQAGADILIPHMGLTTKGTIGAATALTLEESARRVQAMHDAAKRVNADILVLCHGGPIAEPATRSTSSITPKASSASTAPAAWNDCPSSRPSASGLKNSAGCRFAARSRPVPLVHPPLIRAALIRPAGTFSRGEKGVFEWPAETPQVHEQLPSPPGRRCPQGG